MNWEDMTPEERDEYINQDQVGEDDKILYVGGDVQLDWLRMNRSEWGNYSEVVHDYELGEEEIKVLKKCGLTKRQEECLLMYFKDYMTEEEIADELEIAQQVVSEHLEKAKERLYKELIKRRELRKWIEGCKEMTDRQRECAILYYLDFRTLTEVAEELEITKQAVFDHLEKVKLILEKNEKSL